MTAAQEWCEWSAARPGRTLSPGNALGPVLMGRKSRTHWDMIPDRPASSQSLYRLSYRPTIADGAALFVK